MTVTSVEKSFASNDAETAPTVTKTSWYVLGLLTSAYVLNLIDRKLPFILVEPIRKDLGLSDTQIGLLTGAMFMLVYCTTSLPVAKIADRFSRKWVLVTSVAVWSLMTSAGGWATNFWQLGLARAGVAIGESGCMPASHSILADTFPRRRRATVAAVFMMGAPIGMLLGLAGGGVINDLFNWRTAMFLVGAPGLIVALMIAVTIKEPPRGALPAPDERIGVWTTAKTLFATPTFFNLALANVLSSLAASASQSFGPAFIMRTFGMSTSETGIKYGLLVGLGGLIGTLVGGLVNDRMQSRDRRWGLWFVAGVVALSGPFQIFAWHAATFPLFALLLFVPQIAFTVNSGPVLASVQTLAGPRRQAMAVAILLVMGNGVGASCGPLLAGLLSDNLRASLGKGSLGMALTLVAMLNLWAALHYLLAANKLRRDLDDADGRRIGAATA